MTDRIGVSGAAMMLGLSTAGVYRLVERGDLRRRGRGARAFSLLDLERLRAHRLAHPSRRGRPSSMTTLAQQAIENLHQPCKPST